MLKAQGNKAYVPFTVNFDSSKVTGGSVTYYIRVMARADAAPAAPAAGKKDDKKDPKPIKFP